MRFSTAEVAKLAGASLRQVRYWHRTCLVIPAGKATGWRSYTFRDLVAVKTVAELRAQGCPLQTIRRAVGHLMKHYPDGEQRSALASQVLVSDGQKVYLRSDADKIVDVLTGQHVLWIVPVGRIIQETQEQTQRLPVRWVQPVRIEGQEYHLEIARDLDAGGFNVQCRELLGAVEQGETVEEAVENGKGAIAAALAFMRKRAAAKVKARRRA